MSVNYTRINWEDSPSTQTPLNAENLNAMDSAINDLAGAVNNLDGVTDDVEELQTDVAGLKNDLTNVADYESELDTKDSLILNSYVFTQSGATVDANGGVTLASEGYYFVSFNNVSLDFTFYAKTTHQFRVRIGSSNYSISQSIGDWQYVFIPKEDLAETAMITIRFDNRAGEVGAGNNYYIEKYIGICRNWNGVLYVRPDGSDTSNGITRTTGLLTVNKALEMGAKRVLCIGGRYFQSIDASKSKYNKIEILANDSNNIVQFYDPNSVLTTSETLESGKVYKASVTVSFPSKLRWIYQDGALDASTLITDAERHPLERGRANRCIDTKLEKCSAGNVSDAITEIQDADGYKWYYDSTNHVLYFSRPKTVSSNNAICASAGNGLFSNINRAKTIVMSGITAKYQAINITDTVNSVLSDCASSGNYYDGAFVYDRALNAMFIRCEASRTQYDTSYGDGFNAHSGYTGSGMAKQTTATLIDCWAHDNYDDGFSDHENCESTIIGGLFEYNGKAGVTPSHGAHCTCQNVYSRNNNNGFAYVGEASAEEGGKHGQVIFYNCIAENNNTYDGACGFVNTNANNRMILYNCISIGNKIGFRTFSSTLMTLFNCYAYGNDTLKQGSGFTIANGTLVS